MDSLHLPGEIELTENHGVLENRGGNLTRCRQDSQRDGQIKGRPLFANTRWGQIDEHTITGKSTATVSYSHPHALARFPYRAIG